MKSRIAGIVCWASALLILLFVLFAAAGCESSLTIGDEKTKTQQCCPGGKCPRPDACLKEGEAEGKSPYPPVPPMDLPPELRCQNYAGGSCCHASIISVLRWQGLFEIADRWRKTWSGGAGVTDLARHAEGMQLRYAYTTSGDANFLEWVSATRRGAAIHYFPNHAITFCGYDEANNAVLLDNNRTQQYIRVPKEKFLSSWRGYGGCAMTVVYSPWPPRPWI